MIGEKIKAEIEKAGFDVDAFSAKTEISVSTLYRIFGKDNCEVSQLRKICEVLNLPISYFIDEKFEFLEKKPVKKDKDEAIFSQILSEKEKLILEKEKLILEKERMIEELKKDKSDLKEEKSNLTKKIVEYENIVLNNFRQGS